MTTKTEDSKSAGHIAFDGPHEYFVHNGQVRRAERIHDLNQGGRRPAVTFCSLKDWQKSIPQSLRDAVTPEPDEAPPKPTIRMMFVGNCTTVQEKKGKKVRQPGTEWLLLAPDSDGDAEAIEAGREPGHSNPDVKLKYYARKAVPKFMQPGVVYDFETDDVGRVSFGHREYIGNCRHENVQHWIVAEATRKRIANAERAEKSGAGKNLMLDRLEPLRRAYRNGNAMQRSAVIMAALSYIQS